MPPLPPEVRSDEEGEAGQEIDIPAAPRFEIGSLGWVQSSPVQAEDLLVTAAFRYLSTPGHFTLDKAREVGRALGREAKPGQLAEFLHAFSHLGLGRLELKDQTGVRHVFVGHGIPIDSVTNPPACAIALGFLEGVVSSTKGMPALGAEITCRARGQSECRFLVMER